MIINPTPETLRDLWATAKAEHENLYVLLRDGSPSGYVIGIGSKVSIRTAETRELVEDIDLANILTAAIAAPILIR